MDDPDLDVTIKDFSAELKVFNRYTLKKILGRGGMGVVWLAHDDLLERNVAIKMLPEVVANDLSAVRDLKRETSRSQLLSHPHILRIYDFVATGQLCGITMEVIEGGTLTAKRLEQPAEVFSVEQITGWVRELCEALEYAHERVHIVHRDLKPANLMLTTGGELKVADFGISALVSDSISRVTQHAGASGTPVYMSPQQMMGEKPAVADDIYALGVTLYELLTGKPPFYNGNVVLQVQSKVPPTIAVRREELGVAGVSPISLEWERTIAACLAKEPSERPSSVREVTKRLGLSSSMHRMAVEETERTVAVGVLETEGARNSAIKRRPKAPLWVGVVAAVTALAGSGYYFGVYAPDQGRVSGARAAAEQARTKETQFAEERRIADEKRQTDEAGATKVAEEVKVVAAAKIAEEPRIAEQRVVAEREVQQRRKRELAEREAHDILLTKIASVRPSASAAELKSLESEIDTYENNAPEIYQGSARRIWDASQKARRAVVESPSSPSMTAATAPGLRWGTVDLAKIVDGHPKTKARASFAATADETKKFREALLEEITRNVADQAATAQVDLVWDTSGPTVIGLSGVLYTDPALELPGGSASHYTPVAVRLFTVDMAKLYDAHPKTLAENAKIQAEEQKAKQEVEQMNSAGNALVEEYKKLLDRGNTSEAEKRLKQIQAKQTEVKTFVADSQSSLQKRLNTFRSAMLEEISRTAVKAARARGATVVLDTAGPSLIGVSNIVYADPAYDVSDIVFPRRSTIMRGQAENPSL